MADDSTAAALNRSVDRGEQAGLSEGSLLLGLRWATLTLHAVVFLLGISGNGLVLWIAGSKMKRTVGSILVWNLAAADLAVALLLPLSFAYVAMGFHWPFGRALCKVCVSAEYLNLFASVFLLTAISGQRCAAITAPVWSRKHLSPRVAGRVSLAVWALALIATAPYLAILDTVPAQRGGNRTSCRFRYALPDDPGGGRGAALARRREEALVLSRFTLAFAVPLTAVVCCYAAIAARLRRSSPAGYGRPLRVMAAVVGAFFACWLPYHIFALLKMAARPSPAIKMGFALSHNLALFNSCLNPIVYVFMGHNFRKTFKQSLTTILERIVSE